MAKQSGTEVKRVGKFAVVGVINTIIDFGLYNVLSGSAIGLGLIPANIISTTVAMIFSFVANKSVVFESKKGNVWVQALKFFAVTAFGLYVLQNGVIHLLTVTWTAPLTLATNIVHTIGLGKIFSDSFVFKNGAKIIGTIVSLTWNYIMYKKFVFNV